LNSKSLSTDASPVALIFRLRLLSFSETFIRAQASSMRTFRPFYVGAKTVPGLDIPTESSWIANRGGMAGFARELRFRFVGPSHDCVTQLQRLKPKLIHAHFGADACEAVPLAQTLNLPLIATFHGYDATRTDEGLAQTREGRTYLKHRSRLHHSADLLIAVSDFIGKKVAEMGFPQEKIRVQYIGVDLNQFRPPETFSTEKRVLFVARLVEKKGCSFLVDAMADVQAQVPDAELVIVGDGPERATLEARAQQSLRNFKFLGAQPPAAVTKWMQTSTVFCVPSITATDGDAEGLPIVFAEAHACGLPVVSFESGGTAEAVAHGVTGFLGAERDSRFLAESLLQLLTNPSLLQTFRHSARQRAEEKFDLQKQTAGLERIYEDVIASHNKSPRTIQ
jgi:colanic acid/amylovoran biosynthesis glycosyltransferase